MIPVDQTISDGDIGDCMRAVVASLLDMQIEAVPHFLLHGDNWFGVFWRFLDAVGWVFEGSGRPKSRVLLEEDSIGGYFLGIVPSKNFEGKTHAVVLDCEGNVAHDPSPNKNYQGVNVLQSGELKSWYMVSQKLEETARA